MATTPEQVGIELGRPITDGLEVQQVTSWITRAENKIRSRLGDLALLDQAVVTDVVVQAVARKVRNPDGKVSEDVDDYRYRLNDASRKGEVFITDEEWADLSPDLNLTGAFSTSTFGEPDPVPPYSGAYWQPSP